VGRPVATTQVFLTSQQDGQSNEGLINLSQEGSYVTETLAAFIGVGRHLRIYAASWKKSGFKVKRNPFEKACLGQRADTRLNAKSAKLLSEKDLSRPKNLPLRAFLSG